MLTQSSATISKIFVLMLKTIMVTLTVLTNFPRMYEPFFFETFEDAFSLLSVELVSG